MSHSDPGVSVNEVDKPEKAPSPEPSRAWLPVVIGLGVVAILGAGGYLYQRSRSKVNHVALESQPRPVTVAIARATTFRQTRRYVSTLQPWVSANVGPQLVSAYAETVLVRPGAVVKAGAVLATLDCRKDDAEAQAVAMQAKAIEKRQAAAAMEAARLGSMVDAGFVSEMDSVKKLAESDAEQAQLFAERAKLAGQALDVNDCILRAPFDGEVSGRYLDPGAFVRPGMPIVSVVDRNTVRVVADVPESDFSLVAPGNIVTIFALSTGKKLQAPISRRAPAADPNTRTVHFEIDIADPKREIPVGTTAELKVDAGEPVPATELPLYAADLHGESASLFIVDGDVVRKRTVPVLGEIGGDVYIELAALKPGTQVITEGRSLLEDGEHVIAKEDPREAQAKAANGGAKP